MRALVLLSSVSGVSESSVKVRDDRVTADDASDGLSSGRSAWLASHAGR